ncbi:transmembrane emp24 domain-containing protein 5 isoform X2 [Lynx rufus]|uniref:transmembrane emp24 domain-containing protein 5 isoform X2 n=1 Tax=Lynx rufus TaxID=61384 RepID=UPI001F12812F|nr:transmembrane emp24 domain-containing protein 5 isoform X2 [Lynx rufus]
MGVKIWLPFPVLLLAILYPVLLPVAAAFTPSLDSDFTFTLPAGQKECFYQPMPLKASLEIEYQVLDGAGLDIDFHLASPQGRTLVFEQRKSDGVHTIETEDGDYMFCFDNTFSTISEKVIFFELILDNMGEQVQEQEDWKKYITGTDMLDMKLEDILVLFTSFYTWQDMASIASEFMAPVRRATGLSLTPLSPNLPFPRKGPKTPDFVLDISNFLLLK